jgi:hypothetical protein
MSGHGGGVTGEAGQGERVTSSSPERRGRSGLTARAPTWGCEDSPRTPRSSRNAWGALSRPCSDGHGRVQHAGSDQARIKRRRWPPCPLLWSQVPRNPVPGPGSRLTRLMHEHTAGSLASLTQPSASLNNCTSRRPPTPPRTHAATQQGRQGIARRPARGRRGTRWARLWRRPGGRRSDPPPSKVRTRTEPPNRNPIGPGRDSAATVPLHLMGLHRNSPGTAAWHLLHGRDRESPVWRKRGVRQETISTRFGPQPSLMPTS